MKVTLLSVGDIEGGAARAAYRLHQGLKKIPVESQLLVQSKFSDDSTVISDRTKLARGFAKLRPTLDALPLQIYPQRKKSVFSCSWLPDDLPGRISKLHSDILNLHWICDGFIQIESLAKFRQPIVWTLHDMWAFTGGCHYSQECDRYTHNCGSCPQLNSLKDRDLSRWIWKRKAHAWKNLSCVIVCPSHWLAECVRNSTLFNHLRVEVIPNSLNTERYKPINKNLARQWLNLPQNKNLILFVAMKATQDQRKGFHLLQSVLQEVARTERREDTELVIVGAGEAREAIGSGMSCHYLGVLKDDISLALVYSAADVFAAPSTQDNLPNTVMEAIACGTPCIAFNVGGLPDLIEHRKNGYLARPFEVGDFTVGLIEILSNKELQTSFSQWGRDKAEREFSQSVQAERYLKLFEETLLLQ